MSDLLAFYVSLHSLFRSCHKLPVLDTFSVLVLRKKNQVSNIAQILISYSEVQESTIVVQM